MAGRLEAPHRLAPTPQISTHDSRHIVSDQCMRDTGLGHLVSSAGLDLSGGESRPLTFLDVAVRRILSSPWKFIDGSMVSARWSWTPDCTHAHIGPCWNPQYYCRLREIWDRDGRASIMPTIFRTIFLALTTTESRTSAHLQTGTLAYAHHSTLTAANR